ncbi:MAG: chorismate mutase, partial [Eubacterium sp.]|nr:chorismate mutase [Eubacterium sp.]
MSDINDYRNGINEIDTKMAELFEERLQLCRKIAAY